MHDKHDIYIALIENFFVAKLEVLKSEINFEKWCTDICIPTREVSPIFFFLNK